MRKDEVVKLAKEKGAVWCFSCICDGHKVYLRHRVFKCGCEMIDHTAPRKDAGTRQVKSVMWYAPLLYKRCATPYDPYSDESTCDVVSANVNARLEKGPEESIPFQFLPPSSYRKWAWGVNVSPADVTSKETIAKARRSKIAEERRRLYGSYL